MQTSGRTPFTVFLLMLLWVGFPPRAADLPNSGTLNLRIPQQKTSPVFSVDVNTITPAMDAYLNAVREKIQQTGMKDWPKDVSGRRISGEVVVRMTLRKDGLIEDIQTTPLDQGDDALSESVRRLVKSAEPFLPFSPSLFEGCELISFNTTVGDARSAGRSAGKPAVGAEGNNRRLEMRTRIPF